MLIDGCHVYASGASYVCLTDQACSRHVDHYHIPGVSMPLLGVGLLLETREHGTQNQGRKLFKSASKDHQSSRFKNLAIHLAVALHTSADLVML